MLTTLETRSRAAWTVLLCVVNVIVNVSAVVKYMSEQSPICVLVYACPRATLHMLVGFPIQHYGYVVRGQFVYWYRVRKVGYVLVEYHVNVGWCMSVCWVVCRFIDVE